MWVDCKDFEPLMDGKYWVQTVYSDVKALEYTHEGGWNTHYSDGLLYDKYAMNDGYIVRWHKVDLPPAVPEELKEGCYRELVRKES